MRCMSTYAADIRLHAADRDGRPAPRWAVTAAHLVPLTTLPSALWRLPLVFGFSMGALEPSGAAVHVTRLGERLRPLAERGHRGRRPADARPRQALGRARAGWIPVIGGRRIPPLAVIVPAAIGAVLLALIWGFAFRDFPGMNGLDFTPHRWKVLLIAAYAPLLAWAPLLAAVTYAYYRRRCRD